VFCLLSCPQHHRPCSKNSLSIGARMNLSNRRIVSSVASNVTYTQILCRVSPDSQVPQHKDLSEQKWASQMPTNRTEKWLLLIALSAAIVVRLFLSTFAIFVNDFHNYATLGRFVLSGVSLGDFGVYTVPAYISSAALSLWLWLSHDPQVQSQLYAIYVNHPPNPGSLTSLTSEMLAFTFVMKLPMLIADFLTIIAIITIVKSISHNTNRALFAGLLWASSPIVFLFENSYLYDIYPALLILVGAFAIRYIRPIAGSIIGSAFLAVGILIRLSPVLFVWIYLIALLRLRQLKNLVEFLGVQAAIALLVLYSLVHTSGWNSVTALAGARPGIVIPEALTTLGPFITSTIKYNPYGIGLSFILYLLMAYFITKPATWQSRSMGLEVLAFFAPYYALTSFSIPYLLWALPTILVYALTTRFGSTRFLLSTWLAFAAYLFESSPYIMASSVFFIPNMNTAMSYLSSFLYQLNQVPLLPQIFRSLFSATLLLVVFWVLKEQKASTSAISPPNPSRDVEYNAQALVEARPAVNPMCSRTEMP
jgi:hypothetical protein